MIRQMLKHSSLKELDRDGTLFTEETIANLSAMIARALPAAFAIVWLTITLFNLWMAGLIVEASGRALRPWPDLHALELPNGLVLDLRRRACSHPSCRGCRACSPPGSPERFCSPTCCRGLR